MRSPAPSPARHPFGTAVRVEGRGAVIAVRGTLDIAHEPAFSQAVERARRDGRAWLRIDLSDLDVIDSVGVSAILRICREWAEQGRTIELVPSSSPAVARVFSLIGVD